MFEGAAAHEAVTREAEAHKGHGGRLRRGRRTGSAANPHLGAEFGGFVFRCRPTVYRRAILQIEPLTGVVEVWFPDNGSLLRMSPKKSNNRSTIYLFEI